MRLVDINVFVNDFPRETQPKTGSDKSGTRAAIPAGADSPAEIKMERLSIFGLPERLSDNRTMSYGSLSHTKPGGEVMTQPVASQEKTPLTLCSHSG
jgi:hypothetical protein